MAAVMAHVASAPNPTIIRIRISSSKSILVRVFITTLLSAATRFRVDGPNGWFPVSLLRGTAGEGPSLLPSLSHSGEWRNWQTRRIQVPVSERTWGFNSPLAHFQADRPRGGARAGYARSSEGVRSMGGSSRGLLGSTPRP